MLIHVIVQIYIHFMRGSRKFGQRGPSLTFFGGGGEGGWGGSFAVFFIF